MICEDLRFLFFMNRKTAFALILGLLTASGVWLLKTSTPFGLGLTDDAISYIAAARALLAGQGFTRIWLATGLEPITHWPPAFPATLAAISLLLKIDPYRSARFLNILIFGANAGILGLLGYKMTKSYLESILLSILFLSSSSLLRLHAQALSEPLYLFISLLAFLAFANALRMVSQKQPTSVGFVSVARGLSPVRWLILAGFLTGLSYLTRYAALSLIATFIVAIFILYPTWRKRFTSLAFFLTGALPPVLAWMLRNKLVGGSATNRTFQWHPVTQENIFRGLRSFFQFLLPLPKISSFFNQPFFLILFSLLIALALLLWILPKSIKYFLKSDENPRPAVLPFITTLYIFSYLGSLLISLFLFDAATPLNDRILSPVYLAILIMLVYFIHKLFEQNKITLRILSIILAFFLFSTSLIAQIHTVGELKESPLGFASWRWRESTVMEVIRDLPEDVEIYTNQPPAVYFWTGRPSYSLWGGQPDPVREGDAVLAIFFPPEADTPEYQAWFAKTTAELEAIQKSGLGNLYQNK